MNPDRKIHVVPESQKSQFFMVTNFEGDDELYELFESEDEAVETAKEQQRKYTGYEELVVMKSIVRLHAEKVNENPST